MVSQASERNRTTSSLESKLEKSLSYSAINTAKAIAIFGNRQIIAQNWQLLQDYADNLVKNEPLTYIAIVDVKNRARVHTNRRFIGKELPSPSETSDVIEVSVPVMDYTKQVAAVRVGVKYPSE